jgi:hypothetical protein
MKTMLKKQELTPKVRAMVRKNTIEYLKRLKAEQKPLVITAELITDDETPAPAPDLPES